MFRRNHNTKRSHNILFVIFRLFLSIVMFGILLVGLYTAYKHFSGLDPLKLDPAQILNNVLAARTPKELVQVLAALKIEPNVLGKSVAVNKQQQQKVPAEQTQVNPLFRFLLIADSHADNNDLEKAVAQAKAKYPDLQFVIGLGDFSEAGTVDELKKAKNVLDSAGLRYFLVPGDHDLWDCRNRNLIPTGCFKEVFGLNYQSFIFNNYKFLLINNSDNYQGIDNEQLGWIKKELEQAKTEGVNGILVFMHEPLFHPSSGHTMGEVDKSLQAQAEMLLFTFKQAGVRELFAGNIHFFSNYIEPKTGLKLVTIGAVTIDRNPQAPRYGVVGVLEDGNIQVEDVEIK